MPPEVTTDQADWFAVHLKPHEAMLRAWLLNRFSKACDVDDIIQETYLRVIRARDAGIVRSPKAFLFATARNLAVDQLRHPSMRKREFLTETEMGNVLDGGAFIPEIAALNQELELLKQAIQSLPDRCRRVITLRKIYGMSQKDIAAQLGISENTVEAQGVIGLKKIALFFEKLERDVR